MILYDTSSALGKGGGARQSRDSLRIMFDILVHMTALRSREHKFERLFLLWKSHLLLATLEFIIAVIVITFVQVTVHYAF